MSPRKRSNRVRRSPDRTPTGEPEVGARIRAAREKEELTQAQLARAIGLTQGLVSQYEHGVTGIPSAVLAEIAVHVRENAGFLLTGVRGMARELEAFQRAIAEGMNPRALRKLKQLTPSQIEQIVAALAALVETAKSDPDQS